MAENVIHVRGTRASIMQVLRQLPAACQGDVAIAQQASQELMARVGMAALRRIRSAFVVKSRGGTDDCGESWQPLRKSTIAYSRRYPGVPRPPVRAKDSPSWMLTEKQRKRWWTLYKTFSGVAPAGAGYHAVGANRGWAAARAWLALRAEFGSGVKTLMSEYGDTQVDILRDTGLLLNSLSPGVETQPSGGGGAASVPQVPNQVFRVGHGEVIVGTNRKWAAAHHNGIPGRLPQRRLWAAPGKWPRAWWNDLLATARDGLIEIAIFMIQRRSAA